MYACDAMGDKECWTLTMKYEKIKIIFPTHIRSYYLWPIIKANQYLDHFLFFKLGFTTGKAKEPL